MAAQAFFYNAIFFTYALILTDFFGNGEDRRVGGNLSNNAANPTVPNTNTNTAGSTGGPGGSSGC
jgi:hypothetical protein